MKKFRTIDFIKHDHVGTIWLNRPEIHNAFNEVMIGEILNCFEDIQKMDYQELRAVVIRGQGKSFCAGADLNWMRDVAKYSHEENYAESYRLSACFNAIYSCKFPTIAVVHGAAIGGANGLLAACDFAICEKNTIFSLSEVKIGIVPACISPYVIKRVGEYGARELMLTGMRFRGKKAKKCGLVNGSYSHRNLEIRLEDLIMVLKTSGPVAVSQCKELIDDVKNNLSHEEAMEYTAKMIADIRQSAEGQEGMTAFLEKRKPNWVIEETL
ncbi:MAG: enoyl-CoA hydratase-related protein [Marinifilaceae bacterium]